MIKISKSGQVPDNRRVDLHWPDTQQTWGFCKARCALSDCVALGLILP